MSLYGSLLCRLNRHVPVRRNVHWDGAHYVGECRRCGAPIRRSARKTWRAIENASDERETP